MTSTVPAEQSSESKKDLSTEEHEDFRLFGLIAFLIARSEEHTSELQSHHDLVCRLLLEKKSVKLEIGRASCRERV